MKINTLLLILIFTVSFVKAQVGINTVTPNPAAVLDINSQISVTPIFGGLKLPTLTNTERATIPTPIPEGLAIFNSEDRCFQMYNASLSI